MGCAPLLLEDNPTSYCGRATRILLRHILATPTIRLVVVSSRGPSYITGSGFGYIDVSAGWDQRAAIAGIEDTVGLGVDTFRIGLQRLVSELRRAGKSVVVVADVPELGFHAQDCIVGRPFGIRSPRVPCGVMRSEFEARSADYRSVLTAITTSTDGAQLFDAAAILCGANICTAMDRESLLYSDDDHLSIDGSRMVGRALGSLLQRDSLETGRSFAQTSQAKPI